MKKSELNYSQLQEKIATLPRWKLAGENTMLLREVSFLKKRNEASPFMNGLYFVQKVAVLAETLDHHPDIVLSYPKVEIKLTTHECNGLTDKDFQLAALIESVISEKLS